MFRRRAAWDALEKVSSLTALLFASCKVGSGDSLDDTAGFNLPTPSNFNWMSYILDKEPAYLLARREIIEQIDD